MAKLESGQQALQSAQCIETGSYTGRDGKVMATGKFRLDGDVRQEFEVFATKYFKSEKDKFYYPVLEVVPILDSPVAVDNKPLRRLSQINGILKRGQ